MKETEEKMKLGSTGKVTSTYLLLQLILAGPLLLEWWIEEEARSACQYNIHLVEIPGDPSDDCSGGR